MPAWADWYADPKLSGGALLDLYVHDLDYCYHLFGKPKTVYALGVPIGHEGWGHIVATLDYGEVKAVAEASHLMPQGCPFTMGMHVLGTDGFIQYAPSGGQIDKQLKARPKLTVFRPGQPPEHPQCPTVNGLVAEIECFVNALEGGPETEIITLTQARDVLEIAMAARESMESGRVIALEG
jgi:predicted dehydrogenase